MKYSRVVPGWRQWSVAAWLILTFGCAKHTYVAAPINTTESVQAIAQARPEKGEHRQTFEAHAGAVPSQSQPWTIAQLGFLAALRSAEGQYASRQVDLAEAKAELARFGPKSNAGLTLQYNSDEDPGDSSHWSVGPNFEFLWSPIDKGRIRVALANTLQVAARMTALETAWRVRAKAITHAAALALARQSLELIERRIALLDETSRDLGELVGVGLASAYEHQTLQLELASARLDRVAKLRQVTETAANLAVSLKLPLAAVRDLRISPYKPLASIDLDARYSLDKLQAHAISSHPRILRALADYDRSERALELSVAEQYPNLRLNPGYLFDQGDNVWSFVGGIVVPDKARLRAEIASAERGRDLARSAVEGAQQTMVAELHAAHARMWASMTAIENILALGRDASERASRLRAAPQIEPTDEIALKRADLHLLSIETQLLEAQHRWLVDITNLETLGAMTLEDGGFTEYLAGLHGEHSGRGRPLER